MKLYLNLNVWVEDHTDRDDLRYPTFLLHAMSACEGGYARYGYLTLE